MGHIVIGATPEPLRCDDFQDEDEEEDFFRFSLITFDLVDGS